MRAARGSSIPLPRRDHDVRPGDELMIGVWMMRDAEAEIVAKRCWVPRRSWPTRTP